MVLARGSRGKASHSMGGDVTDSAERKIAPPSQKHQQLRREHSDNKMNSKCKSMISRRVHRICLKSPEMTGECAQSPAPVAGSLFAGEMVWNPMDVHRSSHLLEASLNLSPNPISEHFSFTSSSVSFLHSLIRFKSHIPG